MAAQTRSAFAIQFASDLGWNPGGPYATAEEFLAANGIITGGSLQRPNDIITRDEVVTMMGRAFDVTGSSTSFTDVDTGSYAHSYIAGAEEGGIITGVGGGLFGSGDDWNTDYYAGLLQGYRTAPNQGAGNVTPWTNYPTGLPADPIVPTQVPITDFNVEDALLMDPAYNQYLRNYQVLAQQAQGATTFQTGQLQEMLPFYDQRIGILQGVGGNIQSSIGNLQQVGTNLQANIPLIQQRMANIEQMLANLEEQRELTNEAFGQRHEDLDFETNQDYETRGFWRSSAREDQLAKNEARIDTQTALAMSSFDDQALGLDNQTLGAQQDILGVNNSMLSNQNAILSAQNALSGNNLSILSTQQSQLGINQQIDALAFELEQELALMAVQLQFAAEDAAGRLTDYSFDDAELNAYVASEVYG